MEKNPDSKSKVIKISRFQIGLNVLIQLLVVAVIVVMVNYLSFRHFKRWDLSRDQKYALSSQTKNLLGSLKKKVNAIIFFSSASEVAPDVTALLREYEFASNRKFVTEVVDPFRNLTRASELSAKYKFGANENILILDYDGRSKFVNAGDMAEFEQPDQMAMMMGQTQAKMKSFKGEQAITSALLELTEGKPNKLYTVTGHGEMEGEELQAFNLSLKRQNIEPAPLNLLNASDVPADARALFICGPKRDFSELEVKLLSDYWAKKGRVFILLNAFAETPRLDAWLADRGVKPQRDRVMRVGLFMDSSKSVPEFKKVATSEAAFVIQNSETTITRDIAGMSQRLLGPTESLLLDRTKETTAKLKLIPILSAVENSWGETDLGGDERQAYFDVNKDHSEPLVLAAAVEQGGVADSRVKVDTARLFVAGNGEMVSDKGYRLSEAVTLDVALNALNWLLDREEIVGIAPKEKNNIALSLSEKQLGQIALAVMAIIPGFVALMGLLTYWQRRA